MQLEICGCVTLQHPRRRRRGSVDFVSFPVHRLPFESLLALAGALHAVASTTRQLTEPAHHTHIAVVRCQRSGAIVAGTNTHAHLIITHLVHAPSAPSNAARVCAIVLMRFATLVRLREMMIDHPRKQKPEERHPVAIVATTTDPLRVTAAPNAARAGYGASVATALQDWPPSLDTQ